jgi:hypothetical protein
MMENRNRLTALAIVELVLMAFAVLLDVLLPTVFVSAIGFVFLLLRKEKFATIGFKQPRHFLRMALGVFALAIGWTLVNFGLILPILNRLSGTTRDVSSFANLQGNVGELLFLLAVSWTLAAVGEELAYRGFMQNRIISLFSERKIGIAIAVVASSLLFGFAHTEQGIVGVVTTCFDALFYSFVRYKYDNLWAAVLAHGFMNTIGIVTFFFTGPLYGLW